MSIRSRIRRFFGKVRLSGAARVLLSAGLGLWCAAALVTIAVFHDELVIDAVGALCRFPKYFDLLLSDLGFLVLCTFFIEILTKRK